MFRYEILFLTTPEITNDEADGIKSHFSKAIRANKGEMISFERWGKYRLAYPVRKNEYGVYFLTRFDVSGENKNKLIASLKEAFVFKFENLVMKSIVEKLDIEAPLEYRRPESLEDKPQDVDSFLKRNEMEGLVKKGPVRKASDKEEAPASVDKVEAKDASTDSSAEKAVEAVEEKPVTSESEKND